MLSEFVTSAMNTPSIFACASLLTTLDWSKRLLYT